MVQYVEDQMYYMVTDKPRWKPWTLQDWEEWDDGSARLLLVNEFPLCSTGQIQWQERRLHKHELEAVI